MKKSGFTLIELLAVIVILSIISLIAVPIILNIIDNTGKSSAEISMDNIDEAAKLYYSKRQLNNNYIYDQTIFRYFEGEFINDDGEILELDGSGIEQGIITVNPNGTVEYDAIIINGYSCDKNNNEVICEKYQPLSTEAKIKNVIFMVGDGMGENHILAGEIYNEGKLNMQTIENSSHVITISLDYPTPTDSAAAATALATGKKTNNSRLGRIKIDGTYYNFEPNIIEYANSYGAKTGIVSTQKMNHATPAGFSIRAAFRTDYIKIAKRQVQSKVDLILGGGQTDFQDSEVTSLTEYQNFIYVDDFTKLKNCTLTSTCEITNHTIDSKIIGAFAPVSLSYRDDYDYSTRPSLSELTTVALKRLETNSNGFFVMIEGSDIDRYSETNVSNGVEKKRNLIYMLEELNDFDAAVAVAKNYVDNNPNTLLIVTADHETGNLNLNGITSKQELINAGNSLFEAGRNHTNKNVLLYAYGEGASDLTKNGTIDNTEIFDFLTQGFDNYHKD
ncbi:MAG: alkaline phosphatase [Bacilli bacterium]|nr:alkaline phosphatase [Bacilli bacterium]